MKELHDITTSLLDDRDGSCRDLNFEEPTWDGVARMLDALSTAFEALSATDHEGRTLLHPSTDDVQAMAREGKTVGQILGYYYSGSNIETIY